MVLLVLWLWVRSSGRVVEDVGAPVGTGILGDAGPPDGGLGDFVDLVRDDGAVGGMGELVAEVGESVRVADEELDLVVDESETVVPVLGRLLGGYHWLRILLPRAEFDVLESTPCVLARRHSVSDGGRCLVSVGGDWRQIRAFMGIVAGLLIATEPDYCSVTILVAGQYMGRVIGVGGVNVRSIERNFRVVIRSAHFRVRNSDEREVRVTGSVERVVEAILRIHADVVLGPAYPNVRFWDPRE